MALSKERQNEILLAAQEYFETGHGAKNAKEAEMSNEEYVLYCEYVNYGPCGFYEEFYDVIDFDKYFAEEYGAHLREEAEYDPMATVCNSCNRPVFFDDDEVVDGVLVCPYCGCENTVGLNRATCVIAIKERLCVDDDIASIIYNWFKKENSLKEFETVYDFADFLNENVADFLAEKATPTDADYYDALKVKEAIAKASTESSTDVSLSSKYDFWNDQCGGTVFLKQINKKCALNWYCDGNGVIKIEPRVPWNEGLHGNIYTAKSVDAGHDWELFQNDKLVKCFKDFTIDEMFVILGKLNFKEEEYE